MKIRGMHTMCWHRNDWNYHPSLPMKRLQQVQDIVDMNANLLLWSCLGSGAIGIQYLDREAKEPIPPRARFYGYLNDKEFIEECGKRGVTAFAVIWKAQLWEFPAEFNQDETEILALNKLRGVGTKGWIGMRELSTDRYPKIFPSIRQYFPKEIIDSDGNPVQDFLAEFQSITLDGKPILSTWLMVPGHEHVCYTPCGNKPTYRQYLKKEIEMMVEAGAPGIHIDEGDSQLHALHQAGCFCKDCLKGFLKYLQEHPSGETARLDLDHFDYRKFLKEKGFSDDDLVGTQMDRRFLIPFFREFVLFNLQGMEQNVAELAEYARAFSLQKHGKPVLITSNLFHGLPRYAALRKYCELIIGEKSDIQLRQDGFYRFGQAFLGGKPGCFIEDPNEYVLQIIQDSDQARNDSYILFMLEPLAHGFQIAIPYGAWLMNLKKDSFYPNLEIERQIGEWLKKHADLFTNLLVAETALLYDQRSALETELFLGGHQFAKKDGGFRTFHELCQALCDQQLLYKVIYVSPDEPLIPERLSGYRNLILPDAFSLPANEIQMIRAWMNQGGRVISLGKVNPRLECTHYNDREFRELRNWILEAGVLLEAQGVDGLGISLHQRKGGYTLHLVNYHLNSTSRVIETIPKAVFKLGWRPGQVKVYAFPESAVEASLGGDLLTIKNIGIYTIVDLQ